MSAASNAYGLWGLVLLNSAVFILFAFSFFKPSTTRDWRSFGAFSAFVVALFVEMLDLFSHDAGHLWSTLQGESGDPHFGLLHLLSFALIAGGFWLLSNAWHVLYHAQRRDELALSGPYAHIRHPQYLGFVLILLGFLLQWPTLLTLLMFPVLLLMYGRLARSEEREMETRFGEFYRRYAQRTPRFLPKLGRR